MIETGTLLQNRYLIERQIGAGGMGAVFLGIDQRFDSQVAIKKTFYNDAELREAFEREARLLNSLHHPVLPHVSDYFSEGNSHYLVMEYIEGEDLSEILKREGAFSAKDVLRWTENLLDALDYLHSQVPPIVHRDIKPQNLKLTPRGDVILLDFGLAKRHSLDTTGVKSVFGYSRKYSPLEQIQGTGTDARSDIFSLGATVVHLLTGKPPIDTLARAASIIAGNSDPLQLASDINPNVPLGVAQILQTALALNVDRRFASAKAMRAAISYVVGAEQELPASIVATIEQNIEESNEAAEVESFPALEAFAAEAENTPETDADLKSEPIHIPISNDDFENEIEPDEEFWSEPKIASAPVAAAAFASAAPAEPTITDFATRLVQEHQEEQQRQRSDRTRIVSATIAALLVWGSLGVWFLSDGTKSSEKPANVSSLESTATPVAARAEQSARVAVSPTPDDVDGATASTTEITPQVLPASSAEKTEIRKTSTASVKPETSKSSVEPPSKIAAAEKPTEKSAEKSKAKADAKPSPTPVSVAAKQTQARKETPTRGASSGSGETRPRVVVKSAPQTSRIEKVLTGDSNVRVKQRDQQMSDVERDAERRRRMADVLRRNGQPIPPR